MSGYLLDTNVLSEFRKPKPNPRFMMWFDTTPSRTHYVSVLTIGEIRHGIELLRPRDPLRAGLHELWLESIISTYADTIVEVDEPIAQAWGQLNGVQPLPTVDSLLAATALTRDLTLVTRNVKDIAATGARTLNPFV